MPEGHTVHRTANQFNATFKGSQLFVDSPQGRFAAGALATTGKTLVRARAIGKQLFLEFDNNLTIRIHLGIYGKWAWHALAPDQALPEPRGELRARFYAKTPAGFQLAELRGPTVCEVLEPQDVRAIEARLGVDPLNPDSGGKQSARFVTAVRKSNKSIASLLMNQAVISGIGNVYRAELLFRARLNPHTPGRLIPSESLKALWRDAVLLLKVGVKHGVMLTRDEHLKRDPGKEHRYFVYKREGQPCRVCGTPISIELLESRKLYWCSSCQA